MLIQLILCFICHSLLLIYILIEPVFNFFQTVRLTQNQKAVIFIDVLIGAAQDVGLLCIKPLHFRKVILYLLQSRHGFCLLPCTAVHQRVLKLFLLFNQLLFFCGNIILQSYKVLHCLCLVLDCRRISLLFCVQKGIDTLLFHQQIQIISRLHISLPFFFRQRNCIRNHTVDLLRQSLCPVFVAILYLSVCIAKLLQLTNQAVCVIHFRKSLIDAFLRRFLHALACLCLLIDGICCFLQTLSELAHPLAFFLSCRKQRNQANGQCCRTCNQKSERTRRHHSIIGSLCRSHEGNLSCYHANHKLFCAQRRGQQ